MERPPIIRTTTRGFVSPYRWGERKWEDYLFDTQALIYDGARAQIDGTSRLRLVVEAGNAQQAEILRAFQQHAADAGIAWDRIADQLETLNDTLVTGFTTLEYWLEYHSKLLESIAGKLDRIVFALEHRLDTEAKELFDNGQKLLKRQLYPEALADFNAAAAKRPVNPLLQLHLAQIHYHIRDDAVPFDYAIAEHHIGLAIRYSRALQVDLGSDGRQILDVVHRTAAHIALVKGGDAANDGDVDAARTELARSYALLKSIAEPSPSSRFLKAQVAALQGKRREAVDRIRSLADYTRSWIPRSLLEPGLSSVAEGIGNVAVQLAINPGPHTQAVLDAAGTARLFAERVRSLEVASPTRCGHLGAEIEKTLARFESGDVDASAARREIMSQLDSTRQGILGDLKQASAMYYGEMVRHNAVALSMSGSAAREYSFAEQMMFGPAGIALSLIVSIVVLVIRWGPGSSGCFPALVVAYVVVAASVVANHEMKSARFRAQAEAAGALSRANEEKIDGFNKRLTALGAAEAGLKLKT